MKIAVVSPLLWTPLTDKFKSLIESEFPEIEAIWLLYGSFEEIAGLVEARQEEADAVVFSGHAAMAVANARLQRRTLWVVLPKAGSSILCALLNAARMGCDITKLSFDSYSDDLLQEIYGELGYSTDDRSFLTFRGTMTYKSYNDDALSFHMENLRSGRAVACLTGLHKVHMRLSEAKLPNVMVIPTRNLIREQLNFLKQYHRAKEDAKGQISVMLITIDFPPDHSIIRERDDLFRLEKMKISQQIYRYAGQLQATVLEASLRDYLLFSTRDIIEAETGHYSTFNLLSWMEQETLYNISIGIGHGETVAVAKSNAVSAMLRAQKHGLNSVYVCMGEEDFLGPFFAKSAPREKVQIDDRLLKVADATGVSVNTIYRLHCFLLSHPRENFTSQELATGLTLSKRSMDRIVQALEQRGFASVMGKRILSKSGRPSRVLSIDWSGSI